MRRLRDIQEVLRILAPKLVLLSFLVDPSASCRVGIPLALELLLYGVLELSKLDGVRREDTKVERSFALLLVGDLSVRNDHVVHGLLLELWGQNARTRDLTLALRIRLTVDCL